MLLQQQVEQLTCKLEQQKKEANEFSYIVSHDLQAPLRMITGFLDLLNKRFSDHLDENAQKYIEFAVGGANKMQQLILDLLEYSRLNTDSNSHELVDLNELVAGLATSTSQENKDLDIRYTIDELPVVSGNRKQVQRLFRELIANSITYRRDDTLHIVIRSKNGNDGWQISIADNGIGIDPAFADKIFTMFRRLHTNEKIPGTGAGLAICRKIADLHEWKIWTEHRNEPGAVICLLLPKSDK